LLVVVLGVFLTVLTAWHVWQVVIWTE